ncbi:MAG: MFS transporter [Acidimicrobiales bacterium]
MPLGRNYHRLWTASGFSNLADGVFQIALPLLALRLTRSPALIAGVQLAARLPWLVFALQAGALADRLDRRRTMVLVNVVRVGLIGTVAILVAFDAAELWLLYLIAFALGIGETLFDTAAQSIMPMLVPADQLSRANGRLYAVELTMNQFVGPPLGGILAGTAIVLAFAGSAASYLVAAVALAVIAGNYRATRRGPPTKLRTDIAEGLRYLTRHRVLRTFAAMTGMSNMAGNAVFAVFPVFAVGAVSELGLSEEGYGFLIIAGAGGSLVGSFVAERVERLLGKVNTLAVGAIAFGTGLLVPGLWPSVPVIVVVSMISGFFIVVWNVVTVSLRQRITPPHLLGRMNASYRLLAWGAIPIGAAIGGALAEVIGIRPMFVVMGLVAMSLAFGRLLVNDADIAAAEAQAADAAEAREDETASLSSEGPA